MRFSIRDYRPEDFGEIWRIDQDCFRPGIAYSRAELMHYIRRPGVFCLIAQSGGEEQRILGFAVAERERRAVGHVITLDVSPEYRCSGLGSALMAAAEDRLRAGKCTAVFLEAAVDNSTAIHFYKKFGYFVLKTIPRYYQNKLDALLMGKKL